MVEDVDCSFSLNDRTQETKLTVIKRTAAPTSDSQNRVSRLDPALLRPGRMDVHIHMTYCTFCGFKTLAFNYLGLTDHPLFPEVAQAICAAKATPAEVSEQLLRSEDADTAMAGLLEFLRYKIKCAESVETVVDKQVKTTESDKKAVAAAPRSRESGWKTVGTSSRVEDASFSVEDLMEFLQARREEIISSAIEWKNNVKKSEES
uniref:AAA+ ATPase At3g28540-like C-terminal domain-containing protein n=1 Tax=Kalanchoe fedtschenkoi TaxID=63787 RepID=A0A7N0TE32_KALFE